MQDNKKELHYIRIGTEVLNILDVILHKTQTLLKDHPDIPDEELSSLLKERENFIKELNIHQKELSSYAEETSKIPEEIEKILLRIKQKLDEINKYDKKILAALNTKKEKIIKEISALADNNNRRKFFKRAKEAQARFVDIRQR